MLHVQFTSFPTLQTPRLLLREVVPSDAAAVFSMRSDPEVMRYMGKIPMQDISEAEQHIDSYIQSFAQNEAVNWAICLKENPELLIGTLGFWRMDKVNHRVEIGYSLSAAYWRKGIMDEAMGAAIEYCFREMNFHSIEANTDPENEGSGKLLEKNGFVKEAYFKENFYFDGQFLDSRIYSKLNPYHTKA